MKLENIRIRMKVRINRLESAVGMLVHHKHLDSRRSNICGIIVGIIPGYGGDCWYVEHEDKSIGAYSYTELEEIL